MILLRLQLGKSSVVTMVHRNQVPDMPSTCLKSCDLTLLSAGLRLFKEAKDRGRPGKVGHVLICM